MPQTSEIALIGIDILREPQIQAAFLRIKPITQIKAEVAD